MNPIIIAEAGVNHNGNLDLALRMIDCAAKAGADYIKFQTFKAENLVTASLPTADYQKINCGEISQFEMLKKLELSFNDFRFLKDYCERLGIGFLSTPFDIESVRFLASLNLDYMKVPSGEVTNLPYLREVAATGIPVIISTGMSDFKEIKDCLSVFTAAGYMKNKITILHCNTHYPTPLKDVNLRAMSVIHDKFGTSVGYSDHTEGITVSLAATALGAAMIEKHFTLDKTLPGPDQRVSVDPSELKMLVSKVKDVAEALGSPQKKPTESESSNIKAARKFIVAAESIKKGEILTTFNLTTKRCGGGLSPMAWDSVVGKIAKRDYHKDEPIDSL